MKTTIQLVSIITATIFLSACGGGPAADSDVKTGQFKDSIVKGLSYETVTQSGVTDKDGTFKYKAGETVTFKIGAMKIGNADGADILYPRDITGSDSEAIKIAQVLQTLDKDSDPDNEGIDITDQFDHEATKNEDIQTVNSLQTLVADINKSDRSLTLVTSDKAKKHMDATILADTYPTFESISDQDDIDSRISIDNSRLKISPQYLENVWLLAKSPTEITSLSANIQSPNLQLVLELKSGNIVQHFRIGAIDNSCPNIICPAVTIPLELVSISNMHYSTLKKYYYGGYGGSTDYIGDIEGKMLHPCIEYGGGLNINFVDCPINANLTIELDRNNKKVITKHGDETGSFDVSSLFSDLSTAQAKFFISHYTKPNSIAARFVDNVKINNLDFDDFSSPTLDTTKWKTGKFSYVGK